MSQENVEIGRQLLDAVNRHDKSAWLALCDPELEWVPPAEWPENATIRGLETIWDFVVMLEEPWEAGSYELLDLIDGGNDKIAGRLGRKMRGTTSGVGAEFDYWNIVTFRDGKQLRSEWFVNRNEALEALALRE